jgi:hypothetical protein
MLIEWHFEQWSREARCSRAARVAIAKQQNATQLTNRVHFEQWSREAQTQFVPRGLRL